MNRFFRHILWTLLLAGCLAGLWAAGSSGKNASSVKETASCEQRTGSLEVPSVQLRGLILQLLQSDYFPFAQGQTNARNTLPVFRGNAYSKQLLGVFARPSEEAPQYALQGVVQQISLARFRAALDASGYYLFALRKIII